MNFVRTVLSKRKPTRIVDEGKVWDWDDPRMPTIRGILRRGMTVAALREFTLKQGPSRNILNLEWGALWALNTKYIDPIAPRHTAIVEEEAVPCRVHGIEGQETVLRPKNAKNASLGTKEVIYNKTITLEQADSLPLEKDEEITLMNWGNACVRSITKDASGTTVTPIDLELHLEGDFKKTKKKLTWLAAAATDNEKGTENNMIPIDLVAFDHLLVKDKSEKDDELEKFLTPVTEMRRRAFADCNGKELAGGVIVQFERKGYHRLDVPFGGKEERMVFFEIPSGKA